MKCSLSGGFVFATPNSLLEAPKQGWNRQLEGTSKPFWLKAHLPELALANVKKCTHISIKLLQTQALLSTLSLNAVPEGWRCSRHTAGAVPSLPQEHARKIISHQKLKGTIIQGNPVVSIIPVALSGLFLMRHNSSPSAYLSPYRESFVRTCVSPDSPLAEARLSFQQEVGREQCTRSWSLQGHDRVINQAVAYKERKRARYKA